MTENAYIHIPFCSGGKCNYCSFISSMELNLKEKYIKALVLQINTEYKGEKFNTLYFGGGTPSLLSIDEFKMLIELFYFEKNAEITIEANPDCVNQNYLYELRNLGINRISIGAQTFDDEILKIIGRKHNSLQTKTAVHYAKDAGFSNISLDFIYGLPMQTVSEFEVDLNKAVNLGIQHISLYGLKIDEGCYFYKNIPKDLPGLDSQADMYLKAVEVLKKAGFQHYEISNFSLPGFNSRHNLNYWDNNSYYGFGCAASGYTNGIRYTNNIDLKEYMLNPKLKIFEQKLSYQEILEEEIFLGLRKTSGINIKNLNKKFDINFRKKYSKIIEKYSDFLVFSKDNLALNTNGFLISNEILSEFIG